MSSNKIIIGITVLSSIVLVSFLSVYFVVTKETKKTVANISSQKATNRQVAVHTNQVATSTEIAAETEGENEIKTYKDEDLGIEFKYPALAKNYCIPNTPCKAEIEIKRTGNKMELVTDPKYSGQAVEIFFKDKKDSLETAVRKKFLNDVDQEKCWVETLVDSMYNEASKVYPDNYQLVSGFRFKVTEGSNPFINSNYCPKDYQNYITIGGLAYFLYNPDVPDRFAAFSLGNSATIDINKGLYWQDTFKFKQY